MAFKSAYYHWLTFHFFEPQEDVWRAWRHGRTCKPHRRGSARWRLYWEDSTNDCTLSLLTRLRSKYVRPIMCLELGFNHGKSHYLHFCRFTRHQIVSPELNKHNRRRNANITFILRPEACVFGSASSSSSGQSPASTVPEFHSAPSSSQTRSATGRRSKRTI